MSTIIAAFAFGLFVGGPLGFVLACILAATKRHPPQNPELLTPRDS